MKVDRDLLLKVAGTARIELTEEEIEEFVPQLSEVLETFSVLDQIDTEGLSPSYQPVKLRNALREDGVVSSLSQEDALRNAKHTKDGYFLGPKAM